MADAVQAIFAHAGGSSSDGSAVEPLDLTFQTARLKKSQADKTELEVSVLRGDLLPAEVVESTWGNYVSACRAKLIVLPSTLAPRVAGLTSVREIETEARSLVFEAMAELKEYEPVQYSLQRGQLEDAERGDDDVATARDDGQRVGRRPSGTQPRKQRRARKVAD